MAGILELSLRLSKRLGLSRKKARLFLRALSEELSYALREEGRITLRGFGSFRVKRGKQGIRVLFHPAKGLRDLSR